MASVTERVSRTGKVTWRVQFRVDRVMRQETFNEFKGAQDFGRLVDRIGGAAARGVLAARRTNVGTPTLRAYTARYLDPESGLLTGIEDGTRTGYEKAAERSFLQILGELPIDAISKADVGRWVAWQEKQPSGARAGKTVAPKTVRNYHAILSSVMAAAVEENIRPDNPAHRTRISRGIKGEAVFLSPEEFTTLLHFIPSRYETFVLFLAGTGCRWGEATAIMWGDLQLKKAPSTVKIERAWKKASTGAPVLKHPKSSMSRRTVSLPNDLAASLAALDGGAPDALVFTGPISGGHLWYHRFRASTWLPAVRKAQDPELCEREGLQVLTKSPTIHSLRHSHASWLIEAGTPLPYVQARLGHESITTTVGTYGHLQPDAHEQMAASVSHTLRGVRNLRQIER